MMSRLLLDSDAYFGFANIDSMIGLDSMNDHNIQLKGLLYKIAAIGHILRFHLFLFLTKVAFLWTKVF